MQPGLRGDDTLLEGRRQEVGVEDGRDDNCILVNGAAFEIEIETRFLGEGAADRGADLLALEIGFGVEQRVAGVEDGVRGTEHHIAAELVGAGPGQNLDASEAEAVEFR